MQATRNVVAAAPRLRIAVVRPLAFRELFSFFVVLLFTPVNATADNTHTHPADNTAHTEQTNTQMQGGASELALPPLQQKPRACSTTTTPSSRPPATTTTTTTATRSSPGCSHSVMHHAMRKRTLKASSMQFWCLAFS